ncbi:MAG: hypothetical protein JWO02_3571 [Solirubrobacterales bacterium]|nr:hypothetical protein [Solirubrobacterales bacterium]
MGTLSAGARDVAVVGFGQTMETVGEGWAEALGQGRHALQGRRMADIVAPAQRGDLDRRLADVLGGRRPTDQLEVHLRHIAGHQVRRMLRLTALQDDHGEVLCAVVTLQPSAIGRGVSDTTVLEAWDAGRAVLLAQPIVDLDTRRSVRHELLLRLLTPEGDVLVPRDVMPVLVRHGRALDLDRWVVDAALSILLRSGERPPGVIEVNLSPAAITAPETFAEHLEHAVSRAAIAPAQLVLGMDLGDVAQQPVGAAVVARRAQTIGCRVALDHAEATPRTLALLHRVPYDILRLDGALVDASGYDPGKLLLLRALLRAVERDGTEPVASEVRDDIAVALLQRNGVTRGQGFFLGAPRDAAVLLHPS